MLRTLIALPRASVRAVSLSASVAAEQPSKQDVEDLFAEKPTTQFQRRSAYSKNRVEIVGGVAVEPVVRVGRNQRPFTILNVITNSRQKLMDGEFKEMSEFHSLTAFGKTAEYVAANIKKGNRVMVEGRLHYTGGQMDENGQRTQKQTHIHIDTVQLMAKSDRDSE